MNDPKSVTLRGRTFRPHKAAINPLLDSRNVLTEEPWTFVALWLKRNKQTKAGFYWTQARAFNDAARGLPLESAPLLYYYSFMNAVKALLTAKNAPFGEMHGVTRWDPGISTRDPLRKMGVEIRANGVLPALSSYFGETEMIRRHTMQDLFFNIPFIHRTYCLTYKQQTDMFIPLRECKFVWDSASRSAYFSALLSKDFTSQRSLNRLPATLIPDTCGPVGAIRSATSVPCSVPRRPTQQDRTQLLALHSQVREDLFYINGVQTLWYAKANTAGPVTLRRRTSTLALAAMHRLSELCRYLPMDMATLLGGDRNWLVSEFISMAPAQVIDEIAAELTGHQILVPNVRPAT